MVTLLHPLLDISSMEFVQSSQLVDWSRLFALVVPVKWFGILSVVTAIASPMTLVEVLAIHDSLARLLPPRPGPHVEVDQHCLQIFPS